MRNQRLESIAGLFGVGRGAGKLHLEVIELILTVVANGTV
jgi:hypothetical protein